MRVLVCEFIISRVDAKKILMLFKKKVHAKMGYFFEMTELGDDPQKLLKTRKETFYGVPRAPSQDKDDYFLMQVFRDVDK